ncbi:invasin domain 3-containing protein [Sanguibacter sp. HDW7]|uniref:Ig-like domain-containing protein n=1 Tax=Sanguibacter sp. HDW7 TaxID=2714931 RepID=UPI001408C4FC|nr:invasin domain 3-containing protein [Sanguibacter sp. HDW7]QIK82336.1 LPXTG cell wall anchor domain-containing protein [Sanguibacter sp. HDW7]
MPTAPTSRAGRPDGYRRPAARILAALTAAALVLVGIAAPSFAAGTVADGNGYDQTFYVDDLRLTVDANPGDGVCASATSYGSRCSLVAAAMETNALYDKDPAKRYLIVPADPTAGGSLLARDGTTSNTGNVYLFGLANNISSGFTGMIPSAALMNSTVGGYSDADGGSVLWFKGNVVVDLQSRIGSENYGDATYVGAFMSFTGENQVLRNFGNIYTAEGAVYVGKTAKGFRLENGLIGNAPSGYGIIANERAVSVVGGASDIVIDNVTFDSLWAVGVNIVPQYGATSTPVNGLTVTGSRFVSDAQLAATSGNYFSGFGTWNVAAYVRDLRIVGNTFNDFYYYSNPDLGSPISLQRIQVSGTSVIEGNTISNDARKSALYAFGAGIYVGTAPAPGATLAIRGNSFINRQKSVSMTVPAVRVNYTGSTGDTGISITDNTVAGWRRANAAVGQVINVEVPVGAKVVVERNTMSNISGATSLVSAETTTVSTGNPLYAPDANRQTTTAYPSKAVVPDEDMACRIDVAVEKPVANGTAPVDPIYVDAYIGGTHGMAQYLGRVKTTTAALPTTLSFYYTGAGDGQLLRLQTKGSDGLTSRMSRTITASGPDRCAPVTWVKQASSQEDPTYKRLVTFDVMSSEPLSGGLPASALSFVGTAKGSAVVSVTPVDDDATVNTRWTVVTRANATGTIEPVVAAGKVKDLAGNPSKADSNTAGIPDGEDPSITYAPVDFTGLLGKHAGATDPEAAAAADPGLYGMRVTDLDASVLYRSPLELTLPENNVLEVAEPGTAPAAFRIENVARDSEGRVALAPTSTLVLQQSWSGVVQDAANPVSPAPGASTLARTVANNPVLDAANPTMTTIDRQVDVDVLAIDNRVVDGTRQVSLDTIVVTDDPNFAGLELDTLRVDILDDDAPSATGSTLAITADGALADGVATNSLAATVRAAHGKPVANALVTFTVPDGVSGASGSSLTARTGADGIARISVVSLVPGASEVGATVLDGRSIDGSPATVTFQAVPVDLLATGTSYTVTTGERTADGEDSHTVTVTLVDIVGKPARGRAAELSATAGATIGAFAETAAGTYTAPVTSTVAGTYTVVPSLASTTLRLAADGNADATFVAGAPVLDGTGIVTIDDDEARAADGSAVHVVTATLADAHGNPATGLAAELTGTAAAGTTVSAWTEVGTTGVYRADVVSTVAGTRTVTVTLDGATVGEPVVARFVAGAPAPGHDLTLLERLTDGALSVTDPAAPDAASVHVVRATVVDAHGNPVAGTTVTFTAPTAVKAADGTSGPFTVTTDAEGRATLRLASAVAGTFTVTATVSGTQIAPVAGVEVAWKAGAVDVSEGASSLSATTGDVEANGTAVHTLTITAVDSFGNPVAGADVAFGPLPQGLEPARGAGTTGVTGADGTWALDVVSRTAGTYMVDTVSIDGAAVRDGVPASVTFTVGAPDASSSTLVVTPDGAVTVGDSFTATITVRDAEGNLVAGAPVGLDLEGAASIVEDGPWVTDESGALTVHVTSTVAGTATLTATVGGATVGDPAALRFVAGAPDLAEDGASSVVGTTGARLADGTDHHTVTARIRDAHGNPVPDVEVTFALPDGLATKSRALGVTDADGNTTVDLVTTVAGTYGVEVTVGGTAVPQRPTVALVYVAGAASATSSELVVAEAGPVEVGQPYTATVIVRDADGNPVAGSSVAVALLADGRVAAGTTDAEGRWTTTVVRTVAGTDTIVATLVLDGEPVEVGTAERAWTVGDPDLGADGRSTVTATTGTRYANGTDAHSVTVTLRDAYGNPVAGRAVELDLPAGLATGDGPWTTAADGTVVVPVTSTAVGAFSVTASVDGTPVQGGAAVTLAYGTGDVEAALSTLVVTPASPLVAGQSYTATVTAVGTSGLPVPGTTVALTLDQAGTDATFDGPSFGRTGADGTFTVTITATSAATAIVHALVAGQPVGTGDGTAVAWTTGDASTAASTISATSPVQADGADTSDVVVTLLDALGNLVTSAHDVKVFSDLGLVGEVVGNADGTWSTSITSVVAGLAHVTFTIDGSTALLSADVLFVATPLTPVVNPSDGTAVTGVVTPGNDVEIRDAHGDVVPGTVTVADDGMFTFVPEPALADGTTVVVVAIDEHGFESVPAPVLVDAIAPEAPEVAPSDGSSVVVTGVEDGAKPSITDGEGNEVPGSWTDNGEGSWTFTPETPLTEEDVVTVVVTDPSGNTSAEVAVEVDTTSPAAPEVAPSDGSSVTVTGVEDGAKPSITDGEGNEVPGSWTDNGEGSWTFTPETPLTEEDVVTVVVTDPSGNTSAEVAVEVDTTSPVAPEVAPSDGSSVTVTGVEDGAKPSITDGEGNEVPGTWVDGGEGSWTFTPETPLTEEDVVTVVVTDPAGDSSEPVEVVIDTTAPAAPVVAPSDGSSVTVTGVEDGAKPSITDGEGNEVPGTWVDGGEGSWTFTPETPLTEEDVVTVVVTDPAGNSSGEVTVEIDTTSPAAPEVAPSDGSSVVVTGVEDGAKPSITDGEGNEVPGTWVDGGEGSWTFTPETPLTEEDVVKVVVTDPAGNSSEPVEVVVDTTAPEAPVVNPTSGAVVAGTAEPGSVVTVFEGDVVLCTTAADEVTGSFSCVPEPRPGDGVELSVVAADAAGNVSGPATVEVDSSQPTTPVVEPSDGSEVVVTGVEDGAKPSITDGEGNEVPGSWTDNGEGSWTFVPETPLTEEDVVKVVVTDPSGNTSAEVAVEVDTTSPAAPEVAPSDGSSVTVTGVEDGAKPSITDGEGNEVPGSWTDNGEGSWTFVPETPLTEEDVVKVVVTDPAGNSSGEVTVEIDTTSPVAPEVAPSDGSEIVVTGVEDGAKPSITDGEGNEVPGSWTDNGEGSWTFVPETPLTEEDVVKVVVTDPAGNSSGEVTVEIDTTSPATPEVAPSDGSSVVVTGVEDGAKPSITDGEGNEVPGSWTDNGEGSWTFTPETPLTEEDVVKVVVTDPSGNTSAEVAVEVDTTSPAAPEVAPSDGSSVTVTGVEDGAKPSITDGEGNEVPGSWTDNGEGSWTFVPETPLTEEDVVKVVVTDPAGNSSGEVTVEIDTTSPVAPEAAPSDGSSVTVTGVEDGAKPSITDGEGNEVPGSWTDNGEGSWTFTPETPLTEEDVVKVVVTDPAGNTSEPVVVTYLPTEDPTSVPTEDPTPVPTEEPTSEPTEAPSEPETGGQPKVPTGSDTVDPSDETTEGVAPEASPTDAPPTSLPTTGSTVAPFALGGLLIMLLGLFLLAVRRRREDDEA